MNAEDFIYSSYMKALPHMRKDYDDKTRNPAYSKMILDGLGHPEEGIPMILVTGSKGKGSVTRMIAFLLEQMGYRVGHFSSPHLLEFTERIRVNGRAISDAEFTRWTEKVKEVVDEINVNEEAGEYISPIAISQAVALLHFKEQRVDVGVIEAGRGGRFDDTNNLPHQAAVITPLMEEHLDKLGPTLKEIVWHKLGIIRQGVERVYIGKQRPDVWRLIEEQWENEFKSFAVQKYGEHFEAVQIDTTLQGTRTELRIGSSVLSGLTIPLLGNFQAENLALAFAVVNDWTNGMAGQIDWEDILPNLRWPGRCEVIGHQPVVLLDGGIHRSSALEVRRLLEPLSYSRLHVVLGIPKDKDIEGVVSVWADKADRLITTETTNPYLDFNYNYKELLDRYTPCGEHIANPALAIEKAKAGLDQHGILLLMGTQSFVGDVKRIWGESLKNL